MDRIQQEILAMTSWRFKSMVCGGTLTLGLLLSVASLQAAEPATQARQILEITGVQGGLVALLGCDTPAAGELAATLRTNDGTLVHGLVRDAAQVEQVRREIREAGVYGPVWAEHFNGSVLPYTDNLVNLLVAEDLGGVTMDEVLRVLVPEGVACIKQNGEWVTTVKPRPDEMDEWTHYLHDPSGNAVSHDQLVHFPRQFQWLGGPRYSRHHDHMSSASAMVSAGGRLFSIIDQASPFSIQLPSDWQLVARDAFNGTILWQREIGPWFSQLQRLKSGPANLPRRLVAMGDTVYVTLALNAPLTALDAATGQTTTTYKGTEGTDEILAEDERLFLVVNRQGNAPGPVSERTEEERTVMAVASDTGERLWEKQWPWVVTGSMSVGGGRVVFFDGERIVALEQETGKELWQSETLGKRSPIPTYFSPCLVLYKDLVLFSGSTPETEPYHADNGKVMVALAADSGNKLWEAPHPPSGYRSAEDLLVIDDTVWTADIFNSRELRTPQTGTVWGRDPRTGEVKVEFSPDVDTHWFHHRCYRAKATDNYLLTSRTGIEFVDFREQHWTCHHWVRGACLYGTMPANGMVYNPPHPCACYLEAKLFGFNALAAHSASRQKIIDAAQLAERLQRGPAYDDAVESSSYGHSPATDWPTLRADAARSGSSAAQVSTDVTTLWQTKLGGRLSSPVVADGRLLVSAIDAHRIHALDATSGEPLWDFTAGGRVDSPPTIWKGRVLFGSTDGHVYCLRADDGRLIWRFRAAPADLRMGAFGQIESVWPVHGSVLIREPRDGTAELWCVAGRSMFLDGGLRLLRLNPVTGEKIGERILDDRVPDSEENLQVALSGLNMPVALPDVLVSDGQYVYMKSQQFDADGNRIDIEVPNRKEREQKGETAHLFCPTGLLDDVWWHRSYWVYGRVWKSGAGGYYRSGRFAPSGRPMVFDESTVYSYGRKPEYYRWTTPMEYMLYAADRQPRILDLGVDRKGQGAQAKKQKAGLGSKPTNTVETGWQQDVPILARAMVLADKTLFVAGPPDLIDEPKTLSTFDTPATQELLARQAAAMDGAEGTVLWAVSTGNGKKLTEQTLEGLPVFDGMIAAGDRLYYATTDGRIIALGK
jgi:outer membrane protein assembly factor BamB